MVTCTHGTAFRVHDVASAFSLAQMSSLSFNCTYPLFTCDKDFATATRTTIFLLIELWLCPILSHCRIRVVVKPSP